MRAIRVHAFGGPEVLRLEEVADPRPGPGQVVVRLHAAGVNPVETYVRSGGYARLPALPYIPGSDGAGEVLAVGEGVTARRVGERVYLHGAPSYCELALADAEAVWSLPEHLDWDQGAAVGIPYATAYLAVHPIGGARPGDWVLVHGASGAVGVAAVQIALAHGCRVVGTAGTPAGRELVLSQGAAAAFGHADGPEALGATGGRGFDLIVEMLADANLGTDLPLLADGGCVAVVGSRGTVSINPRDLMARHASVRGVMGAGAEERRRVHAALGAGLRNRTLVPVVGRRFALPDAALAHRAVMAPGALGKVVVRIP